MYGVGIDLGTSFAAAAVASAGTLDMVRLAGQAIVTPSVTYLDEKGALLTGEAADRLGLQDPGRTAREFKRRLGDPTPVILAGTPYSPTALMAALLRSILDTVEEAQGGPPDRIVLTHPAVWGPYRREQFAAIPHLAGLPRPQAEPKSVAGSDGPTVLTTTEPVAAATYYCSTKPLPPDGLLAVYDLGGGTFDSAVVRNGRDGLEIVGTPEGIEWLGGADFDQAIVDHVDRHLGGAISALDLTDPGTASILSTLHRDCMLAKEALSTREQAEITVPLPDSVRHVAVTREAFEQMITPSVETTVETFRRTLTAAGVTPQDLTAVLLVGGSSQIPLVAQLLRDTLRRPVMINTHPKHAVALGAAMLSADARTARGIPAPQRAEPDAPVTGQAQTVAAVTAAGDDSNAGTAVVVRAPAPKARRGAKHRSQPLPAPVRATSDPAGRTDPTAVPPPARWRRWSRLTVTRFVVALVVVLGLLGAAIVFGPKALSHQPLAPSAETSPATSGQTPPLTDITPSSTGLTPSPTASELGSPSPQPTSKPSRTPSKAATTRPASVAPGGTGVIRSVATGLCVDSDTNPAMMLNGTPLGGHAFAGNCNGAMTQQWHEGPPLSLDTVQSKGWYRLLDQQTGFCLDSNGDGVVYTLPCLNPDSYQLWQRVTPPSPPGISVPVGRLVAYHSKATNRCLSLAGSDRKLRTLPCPTNGAWPEEMLFQRQK